MNADKNDSIDQETTTTDTIDNDLGDQQQHTSSISEEQFSSGSCSPTLPGSPLSATPMWEFTAPASIRCEQSVAGNALHFTFSTNPVGSQPTKAVPDWTQPIREALTESRPIAPFRQMYKPLSDEDMRCVRKRLEGYTDKARKQSKLDEFECAVILEDARTLFSEAVLLKSIIATPTQRVSYIANFYYHALTNT